MPDQSENGRGANGAILSRLEAVVGLWLYLMTLTLEALLGGCTRWALAYLAATLAAPLLPFGLAPGGLAWVAALAPIGFSVSGLLWPGSGRLWRRRIGLRRPSEEELEVISLAFDLFAPTRPRPRIAVLDDPLAFAAVRGATLIVSRRLLESRSLAAALAHESGHLWSLDGRLTEALERLTVWGGRSGGVESGERDECAREPYCGGGGLHRLLSSIFRLAAGGQARRALAPLWCAYWRRREFAADAGAAAVGQGPDLICHLRDEVLPFDISRPLVLFDHAEHAPTALRIERLGRTSRIGGTKWAA